MRSSILLYLCKQLHNPYQDKYSSGGHGQEHFVCRHTIARFLAAWQFQQRTATCASFPCQVLPRFGRQLHRRSSHGSADHHCVCLSAHRQVVDSLTWPRPVLKLAFCVVLLLLDFHDGRRASAQSVSRSAVAPPAARRFGTSRRLIWLQVCDMTSTAAAGDHAWRRKLFWSRSGSCVSAYKRGTKLKRVHSEDARCAVKSARELDMTRRSVVAATACRSCE